MSAIASQCLETIALMSLVCANISTKTEVCGKLSTDFDVCGKISTKFSFARIERLNCNLTLYPIHTLTHKLLSTIPVFRRATYFDASISI